MMRGAGGGRHHPSYWQRRESLLTGRRRASTIPMNADDGGAPDPEFSVNEAN
jgi:hypothetical protein